MTTIKLTGKNFDLQISFPWSDGIVIEAALLDKAGTRLERWQKNIDPFTFLLVKPYLATAEKWLEKIIK